MQKIHLKRTKRLLSGHLWVFSNELYESPKKYAPGSVVELYDRRETFLGMGYINPNSLIAVRILTRENRSIDREFLAGSIGKALELRSRIMPGKTMLRLVYSEGDYLPGLIVDRYGGCLVVQLLTFGMENLREMITGLLDELVRPDVIILKNDSRSRILEGLPLYKEIIKGDLNSLPIGEEDGLFFEIDPYEGQKTGFFLDQSENRKALAEIGVKGTGLDLFCYTGAWAIRLASKGANVTAVDSSERALCIGRRNAELNRFQNRVNFIRDDIFTFLEDELRSGQKKYDFIVCDPPAFIKSAERLKEGLRAYTELNEKCMRLVKQGGLMVTSSCSYQLGKDVFMEMLRSASRHSKRGLRLIALRSQGPDHPVLLSMPESEYLKCAFLIVD